MESKQKRERLWVELSDLFKEDEGFLPEVRLIDLSPDGTARIFDGLLHIAEPLDASQTIWHDECQREIQLADVPNAGVLAATGRINSLHAVLRGIRFGELPIPDLGVSVWPNEIALDYRPGLGWDADTLAGFIELLSELLELGGGGRLAVAGELDLLPEDVQRRFQKAVTAYLGTEK
jgi:hypothetical protein